MARVVIKVGFGLVQVLLLARAGLLFFAILPGDPVFGAVFTVSQPFVDPFRDAVRASLEEQVSGTVVDTHALAALLGYTLVELGLLWVVGWQRRRPEALPPSPLEAAARSVHAPAPTPRAEAEE